jgi:thiol peroxidase
MAATLLGEFLVNTSGDLPVKGTMAPDFVLTGNDLADVHLKDFAGKKVVLNIFPSIDTRVCAESMREFNRRVAALQNTVVLCISKDLPFAMKRFCGLEGIDKDKVITLSDFRDKGFAKTYGVEMVDGTMQGLFARSIVVIGTDGKVRHTELVPSVGQAPDYDAALKAVE